VKPLEDLCILSDGISGVIRKKELMVIYDLFLILKGAKIFLEYYFKEAKKSQTDKYFVKNKSNKRNF
jgi:hypothetical protein